MSSGIRPLARHRSLRRDRLRTCQGHAPGTASTSLLDTLAVAAAKAQPKINRRSFDIPDGEADSLSQISRGVERREVHSGGF